MTTSTTRPDAAAWTSLAQARLDRVDPAAYARSRNALGGAVTGLSPFITHGLLSLPEVLEAVGRREPLQLAHKLVAELGWRAFFRHVWAHRGEAIFASLHEGPLPDSAYASQLPEDLRQGATGLPVIDQAVRQLYATGELHNHARLWLASYAVHLRKLHWRSMADWLYGHLLDGDLASNALSWQWVAGTGSHKPYLFNADNVARFAPAAWHSPGTLIDVSYEQLERWARQPEPVRSERAVLCPDAVTEPPLLAAPPAVLGFGPADARAVSGRPVWLIHPWHLADLPANLPQGTVVIAVALLEFHRRWPWSERRWQFVGGRMAALASARGEPHLWWTTAEDLAVALAEASSVQSVADPHVAGLLPAGVMLRPAAELFPAVSPVQASFSAWWTRSLRGLRSVEDLPGMRAPP
ncbi:deoxyribodipyrimidine photolyase [Pelomonas sp. V22]|nr:deoxyribodipyrimidine photolyase [Pelomonas sp. V22]